MESKKTPPGLSENILSENLLQAITDYDTQKRLYLDKLKTVLEQDPTVLSAEFLTKNSILKDMLQDVNSDVNQLDEAGEQEYIGRLNQVTKLISELLDTMD